ncbi:5'-3' exonuclease [Bacillus thuringiensis]|uniref:5'-3' exonuclease n=1 Tax=Bacillus thuringiensis TaxID=1428 RepID=UPI0021D6684F|nr:5'-3' exonuclease H3TH domain-containing protein [Bacillus thuringiensis]MCU7667756.1 5'-3' exonuclease [Bacillus thuringiensis]
MNRLFLIDGNSLLSTSFFGSLDNVLYKVNKEAAASKIMKTSDGRYTNAVYGMTKTLLKLLKNHQPSHMAVAWDVNRETTFRKKIYPDYKGHRGNTPEELKLQFPIIKEVLNEMGISQFEYEGYEADDIIGSLSQRFDKTIEVIILTKDKDSLQLITQNTKVWLNTSTAKNKNKEFYGKSTNYPNVLDNYFEFNEETFPYFFGNLKPLQIIDFKSLEGDTSDNIPGVKGVGEKAIFPLLNAFATTEEIYEYLENHNEKEAKEFLKGLTPAASRAYKPLMGNKEIALLSKELATIKVDMEHFSTLSLDDLLVHTDNDKILNKFHELEFKSLL